jgi:hypothetical protein
LANTILDRIVRNAYRINLSGDSRRKRAKPRSPLDPKRHLKHSHRTDREIGATLGGLPSETSPTSSESAILTYLPPSVGMIPVGKWRREVDRIESEEHGPFFFEVEEARKLYEIDARQAILKLISFSDQGSIRSMVLLGGIFRDGLMVDKDIDQAKIWYERAMDAGSSRASFYLGDLCWRLKEYEKAESALLLGSGKNYPPSVYWLATFYLRGPRSFRNFEKGIDLLEKGSKLKHIYARREFAGFLMHGRRGFFKRAMGVFLVISCAAEMIMAYRLDPSSPRLDRNGVW